MNRTSVGRLDPDFGEAGIAKFDVPSGYRGLTKALPDNSYISIGTTNPPGSIAILKHSKDGKRDEAFGLVVVPLVDNQDFDLRNAVVQDDGKVVIFGAAASGKTALFARLQADGTLDQGFGKQGVTAFKVAEEFTMGNPRRRSGLIKRSDGTLAAAAELVEGDFTPGQSQGLLLSVDRQGVPETSFGFKGAVYSYSDGMMSFQSLTAQDDGKLLVTGQRERGGLVARYTREGILDRSYDRFGKGYVLIDGTNGFHVELYAACQQGSRTLASGYLLKQEGVAVALVASLQSNGDLDPTFNGGKSLESLQRHQAIAIAALDDQRVLASLYAYGSSQVSLLMLDQTGTPDESFGSGGLFELEFHDVIPCGLELLEDGAAMVCASSVEGNRGAIARVLLR